MRLGGPDGGIELRIVEYESYGEVSCSESEWLVIAARVEGNSGVRTYEQISLDVDELPELATWLKAVAADETGPPDTWGKSVIWFTEPDIAARVTARVGDDITMRWYFEDATSTEDLSNDIIFTRDFMSYGATTVDVVASPHELDAAARDLVDALDTVANRRTK